MSNKSKWILKTNGLTRPWNTTKKEKSQNLDISLSTTLDKTFARRIVEQIMDK